MPALEAMTLRAVGRTERVKKCARCHVVKPWSEFSTRTRWDDGSARTVVPYCRPCATAKRKESYARNPGSKSASAKLYRERVKRDPKRRAHYREMQRFYNRNWNLARGRNVGRFTLIGHSPRLDAAPFVARLRTVDGNSYEIARVTGLDSATVRAFLGGRRSEVLLDTVDRACLHAGWDLNDIYPLGAAA